MSSGCSSPDTTLPKYSINNTILAAKTPAAAQLVWNIQPRYSSYLPKEGQQNMLDISTIGDVSVRYQNETYQLKFIQYHRPIGYSVLAANPVAEISVVLQAPSLKTLHWIFPVVQYGTGYSSKGIRSWLTGQADPEYAVSSFVDIFPAAQVNFLQWTNCAQVPGASNSVVASLTICYCLSAIRIPSNGRVSQEDFSYPNYITTTQLATQTTVSDMSDGRITLFSYSLTGTGVRKQRAKCYSVALDRALDENGNLLIDERTNQPVDPSLLRALQKKDVNVSLAELDDFKRQKEFENTVYFWVMIAIIGVIGVSIVLALIFFLWGKRPVVVDAALEAAGAVAANAAVAGASTTAIGKLSTKKKAAAVAAVSAFLASQPALAAPTAAAAAGSP
jgi:hypothetical protein